MNSKRIPFSRTLMIKDLKTVPSVLRVRKTFNLKASGLLIALLEGLRPRIEISNQIIKRYSLKGTPRLLSGIKSLPYYMNHLRRTLRKLTIPRQSLGKIQMRVEYMYNNAQRKALAGAFSACKQLKSLDIHQKLDFPVFKSIRTLRKLEDLRITIPHDHLIKCPNICQSLTSLKRFSLTMCYEPVGFINPTKLPLLYKFIQNIVNIKTLQAINLQFGSTLPPGNLPVMETILSYIEASKIQFYHIKADLINRSIFDINKAKGLLSQIDMISFSPWNDHMRICQKFKPGTIKSQKTLNFHLVDCPELKISSILEECTSLSCLGLLQEILLALPPEFRCNKNLRNLIIEFPSMNQDALIGQGLRNLNNMLDNLKILDNLFLEISNLGEESITSLKALHSLPCIKSIKCYILELNLQDRVGAEHIFENLWNQLHPLKLLETFDFRLTTSKTPSFKPWEAMLACFTNLKCLKIELFKYTYSIQNPGEILLYFPFDKLHNLEIFHLVLAEYLAEDCAKHMLKSIGELKKLEDLWVSDCSLKALDLETFTKFAEEIVGKENLTRVYLQGNGSNEYIKNEDKKEKDTRG